MRDYLLLEAVKPDDSADESFGKMFQLFATMSFVSTTFVRVVTSLVASN
jgi:hypothetical protein